MHMRGAGLGDAGSHGAAGRRTLAWLARRPLVRLARWEAAVLGAVGPSGGSLASRAVGHSRGSLAGRRSRRRRLLARLACREANAKWVTPCAPHNVHYSPRVIALVLSDIFFSGH
jgi:hypothetical protein